MISGKNKRAYRVNTAMATIGIRGTDYEAVLSDKLELQVHQGTIAVENNAGEFLMHAGDFGFVTDRTSPMQLLPDLIAAAKNNREQMTETASPADSQPAEDIQELVGEEIIAPEIVDNPVEFIGGETLQCIKY